MTEAGWQDSFGDPVLVRRLLARLESIVTQPLRLMEVCGTHTMALFETGLRPLLSECGVELVSGPGCPVCVTAQADLDHAFAVAAEPDVTLATFGDMIRVPGTKTSLGRLKAEGADVRIVYSALDAVKLAQLQPDRRVVFLAVGFETTVPSIAYALQTAEESGFANFFIFPLHKTIPVPLMWLAGHPELRLDGFLCPGHVSVVIGARAYEPVASQRGKPCAITGFEPVDILRGVVELAEQVAGGRSEVANMYERVVKPDGNPAALQLIDRYFEPATARWRGIGELPDSGLELRRQWHQRDIRAQLPEFTPPVADPALAACRCGEVLIGKLQPPACACFGTSCTPAHPLGACMVSQEGSCRAYHKYHGMGGGDG
ncbi:hydrogenase formation protein HypD [bacterium]|nr:hydrogenase formation protein HypD [bacterium]